MTKQKSSSQPHATRRSSGGMAGLVVFLIVLAAVGCALLIPELLDLMGVSRASGAPQDDAEALIPAPVTDVTALAPAEISAGATATPTLEPTEEPTAEPLVPDIQPTPDGAFREADVPILMYHYVSVPPPDADVYRLDLSVTPDDFDQQMAWLSENGFTTITFYDFVEFMAQGAPLPDKPVILTFDDGYLDNYQNAFPILEKYGQVGTFFVLTGPPQVNNPDYMSWDMLREMAAAGQNIEVHSYDHLSFENQPRDWLATQLVTSQDLIEQNLGYRPRFVAYPGGDYDDNAIAAVHEFGFWMAVTTEYGWLHSTGQEYVLKRVRVRGEYTLGQFAGILSAVFEDAQ